MFNESIPIELVNIFSEISHEYNAHNWFIIVQYYLQLLSSFYKVYVYKNFIF